MKAMLVEPNETKNRTMISHLILTSIMERKNDRTTTRRSRQDRRGLDALGTSGVEGSADAG